MKRKSRGRGILVSQLILPILSCIVVFFVFTSFCIHSLLDESTSHNGMIRIPPIGERSRNNHRRHNRHRHREQNDNENEEVDDDDERNNEETVRRKYEKKTQLTIEEIQSRVQLLRLSQPIETIIKENSKGMKDTPSYDIHRCPPEIPNNYPYEWNIIDVLNHWNPDNTTIPSQIHQGLCTIDWLDPRQQIIATIYRENELPFIIKNHDEIWKTTERWSHYHYLSELIGNKEYRNEHSLNNHMMYWKLRRHQNAPRDWVAPTENIDMTFPNWYEKAQTLENEINDPAHAEHYYFRFNGILHGPNDYLYDELPFFYPNEDTSTIFMVEPEEARGINCRLGSKGTIAETHYDESRNFILLLHGQKRYILAHPKECINLELYPQGHPSARHSKVNWSDPKTWYLDDNKHFQNARVNEVVLQAGDGMYLPTYWFHFIISLNMNYQCNARSGTTFENAHYIKQCGF